MLLRRSPADAGVREKATPSALKTLLPVGKGGAEACSLHADPGSAVWFQIGMVLALDLCRSV